MTAIPDPTVFAPRADAAVVRPTPIRAADQILGSVCRQLYADHLGVTVIRGQKLETVASTDRLVAWFDVLQSELGEGPCWDRSWDGRTLFVGDLAADRRWPRWAPKVTALGITSVLAAELRGHDARRIGSITAYWSRRPTLTEDDIAIVNTFACDAASALAQTWNGDGFNLTLDGRELLRQVLAAASWEGATQLKGREVVSDVKPSCWWSRRR